MALDRDQVRQIAALARLHLTDEEQEAFTSQLDNILQYFARLSALDTDDVEPTAHVAATETPFRDDVVENRPAPDDLLANAPARDGNFFKVPKIIE